MYNQAVDGISSKPPVHPWLQTNWSGDDSSPTFSRSKSRLRLVQVTRYNPIQKEWKDELLSEKAKRYVPMLVRPMEEQLRPPHRTTQGCHNSVTSCPSEHWKSGPMMFNVGIAEKREIFIGPMSVCNNFTASSRHCENLTGPMYFIIITAQHIFIHHRPEVMNPIWDKLFYILYIYIYIIWQWYNTWCILGYSRCNFTSLI